MPGYSHIYIERAAADYADTHHIRQRFPEARQIEIEHHGELFNRPRQHFQIQKRSPKLILAVARGQLLYRGSERIDSFDEGFVHYNAQIRNCLYNCEYCFLQGMHNSANILLYVNGSDFVRAAREHLHAHGPYWLSISYLTDLLAFEDMLPLCRRWIEFARAEPDITIEIRTKSDNWPALRDIDPPGNVILVWSLSPHAIAQRHELGTASFRNRLLAAREAAHAGWRLRLCFDPVLAVENWRTHYTDGFRELFERIEPRYIEKISFGVFRMHPDFLSRIRAMRADSPLLYSPFERSNGVVSHPAATIATMRTFVEQQLTRWLPVERIAFVHG